MRATAVAAVVLALLLGVAAAATAAAGAPRALVVADDVAAIQQTHSRLLRMVAGACPTSQLLSF